MSNRRFGVCLSLIVLGLSAGTALAAPITFNTALPVGKGEFINRELLVLTRSGDDPSGAERDAYKHEHDADISAIYERESISISDFVTSLQHDTCLMRESKGTPKHANIYGYLYDIDTDELSLVVEDKGPTAA